jgi:hypothetical protein
MYGNFDESLDSFFANVAILNFTILWRNMKNYLWEMFKIYDWWDDERFLSRFKDDACPVDLLTSEIDEPVQ